MSEDVFLERARLGLRNPILIRHDEQPHLAGVKRRFQEYTHVDLAHVVMLIEQNILDRKRGSLLLGALLEIDALGARGFPWVDESGSCLVQFERFIEDRHGEDVAGRLQTGRSRNDQEGAVERLYQRDLLLEHIEALLELQQVLLGLAGRHLLTVMPGYTHFQHAQPWTFAHYLMRHAYILDRDLQRMRGLYSRTNLSALGGAAQAGTSWRLDRERVAALLGHEAIVLNSNDAGEFARDHIEETLAVLAILMGNLGRFATDLYVFSSYEFQLLEIDDSLAGTSSIMPQKKNPHALERIKALAGQSAGWLPGAMSCQRGVLSTDLDMVFGEDMVSSATDCCRDSLALLTVCLRTLTVHETTMRERAGVYWSTASHLADEIVRRFDISFRTAHQVVGAFVKGSIAAGESAVEASSARLDSAAHEVAGMTFRLGDTALRRLLDAQQFVRSRHTAGSIHPEQVSAQIEEVRSCTTEHRAWLDGQRLQVGEAIACLFVRARELCEI